MKKPTEKIEFEPLKNTRAGEASSCFVKHRKRCRLFIFSMMPDSGEPLFCYSLFEVYWLNKARFERNHVDSLGVEYVLSGSLLASQGEFSGRIMPGELFLMQPGRRGLIRTGPEGYCEKVSLSIHGELMHSFLECAGLQEVNWIPRIDRGRFELLLEKIRMLAGESSQVIRQRNGALSYELLHFLKFPEEKPPVPNGFEHLAEYLHSNLDRPLPLKSLAEMAGCSTIHFIRKFTSCFGMSPGKYIHTLRMTAAAELLLDHPELSIKEISARIGYSNALNFSTAFRKFFNVSPQLYRKQQNLF